ALPLGPTSIAPSMREAPTLPIRSARMEKVATTLRRSPLPCARAGPIVNIAVAQPPATTTCRRVSVLSFTFIAASSFQMPAGEYLPQDSSNPAEQQRDAIEHAGHENDRRARGNAGVEREQQSRIAAYHSACGRNHDHQSDIARPEAADRRREHHDADGEQRAERVKSAHQVDH